MRRKRMPAKKNSASKGSTSSRGKGKVEKVMHEYKHGELKSGSGGKVKSRKQAIAIALNEARESGAKIPRKTGGRKTAAKKKK
jgi:hypothetical protein